MRNYITILLVLLSTHLFAQTYTDIDLDNDGLIEVNDLETLNAMRYQLDGSGLQLDENAVEITTGCAPGGCKGYELTRDLDFNGADSYQNIANLKRWTDGAGWQPIGDATHPFTAIFKTNNGSIPNVIYNLMINRPNESGVGLFGHIGSSAKISGIGLLNAEISGHGQVGGLVGKSVGGGISNSYVSGRVVGKGVEVGSLAGSSSGAITNSYANGEVSGQGNGVGGLVGASSGAITNSYAMGSVVGAANHVGGLVGDNSQGMISNCYTTGSVSGSEDIGGLVGISNLGKLIGNYVSGKTSGKRYIGGLVGINVGGTITRSYWDKTTNDLKQNTGGVGLSASELQSQSAQDDDSNKPYYKWSTENWDFGTAEQYPILKYATGSDLQNPACGPGQTLPNCGALLLGQHASLDRIMFSEPMELSPTFKPTELNYQLNISPQITQLQLTPIASNPASAISISRNGIDVGTTSSVITLDKDTSITIAVSAPNQRPAQYQFAVSYRHEITVLGVPNETINEGEVIVLNASHSLNTPEDQISYRWKQTTGKAILSETADESASLLLFIPADYVPTNEDYAGLGLNIEVSNGKTTLNKNISLMIAKKDNGNIVVGLPGLSVVEAIAPEIDLGEDPDGAGKSLSYQWQHRLPNEDAEWMDIEGATDTAYTIPTSAEWYTEYRVLINYTDRQGYETIATSEATRYSPETVIPNFAQSATPQQAYPEDATPQRSMHSQDISCTSTEDLDRDGIPPSMDIDDDNDGLIEICYLEDLNAIRFVPDGSGYKSDAMATTNTTGCPADGCNGYELARDLDFKANTSYRYETVNKAAWTVDDYDDSEDNGWQPIGTYPNAFRAIFEGNGHTISNLMINRPNNRGVGLFGSTESTRTKIANVGLLDVNIIGGSEVGGLVGDNELGSIINSYVKGKIKGTGSYVGGLVGYHNGDITNSYATVSVTGTDSYPNAGGLVGSNWKGTITNSYATGSVKGDSSVGGLVGENSGTITNSHATGSVKGDSSVGGLVGRSRSGGAITNSYAAGSVKGNRGVGGLVGYSYIDHNLYDGIITNSYAAGLVRGNRYVGGLVGYNLDTITNSYATGSVEGQFYVGGLVGFNLYNGIITNSYATGSVEGTGSYARIGGLVGLTDSSNTITNSYWDMNTSGMTTSAGGMGKTTVELRSAAAQSTDANQLYYRWGDDNWDFGTNRQYPALKYAKGTDINNPACGSVDQPECGSLLLGQYLSPLDQLTLSGGTLSPAFNEEVFSYTVRVNHDVTEITLNTTETDAFIRITSNTTGTTTRMGAVSATIPLAIAGNTVVTVEVIKSNQRATLYVITVSYNVDIDSLNYQATVKPVSINNQIPLSPDGAINLAEENREEGRQIELEVTLTSGDTCGSNLRCEWGFTNDSLVLPDSRFNNRLIFDIPKDYVSAEATTQNLILIFAVLKNDRLARVKYILEVEKENNGFIDELVGQPTLRGTSLIAPDLPDLSTDPDGVNDNPSISYQWQRLRTRHLKPTLDRSWRTIPHKVESTFTPRNPSNGRVYRVGISYTDGQGYPNTVYSQVVGDMDIDDDGLIEIRTLEDLDTIRNNLSGSSYKTDDIDLTTGCPDNRCKGYELTRDLDFLQTDSYESRPVNTAWTTGEGWHPIGSADEPFNAIFDGNGYAISNLKIDRSGSHIGLFAKTGRQSLITNVALLDVDIVGREVADIADDVRIVVGGLVGDNEGMIKHSFVDGMIEQILVSNRLEEMKSVAGGGIAGMNSGSIEHSRAFGIVKGIFRMGGLVGQNNSGGAIKHSYAANNTMGTRSIGGLVGVNSMVVGSATTASIICSHASGKVTGADNAGGLVGSNLSMGEIVESYATGDVGTGNTVGGLVGFNRRGGQIRNSSSFGGAGKKIVGTSFRGALVGRGDGEIIGSHATITSRACRAVEK